MIPLGVFEITRKDKDFEKNGYIIDIYNHMYDKKINTLLMKQKKNIKCSYTDNSKKFKCGGNLLYCSKLKEFICERHNDMYGFSCPLVKIDSLDKKKRLEAVREVYKKKLENKNYNLIVII